MRNFKHLMLTLIAQYIFICSLMAQAEAENSKSSQTENKFESQLTKLNWLVGHWIGDGFGGISEEVWASPVDGAMMGMYRHIKDGKVNFYEFMNIIEKEGKIEMRIKHFAADFKAWEEKDDYIIFESQKQDYDYSKVQPVTKTSLKTDYSSDHVELLTKDELKNMLVKDELLPVSSDQN